MARFRRGSLFVRDAREHSIPLDRNQIARILTLAEGLERRTKAKGCRNGVVSQVGLIVLRALLLRFMDRATGICCPSYDAIQRATGLCRQAVTDALARLARAGIVRWVRRLTREASDFGIRCRQASNLYRISEPSLAHRAPAPRPRAFPNRGPLAALAALATRESGRKSESTTGITIGAVYVAPVATCWRERARSALNARLKASRG